MFHTIVLIKNGQQRIGLLWQKQKEKCDLVFWGIDEDDRSVWDKKW